MAKAIRPLAAQEAQEVLSMLSNLGFHQSKITDKQIEFSGDNLPTIYVNFQRFPTLDAKKLVNAPKMSAHHRGICHF